MKPDIREATADDIRQFFPGKPKPTMRAWVGDLDGEVIGIGGWAFAGGRWYGFCDFTDRARELLDKHFIYKVILAKAAKAIIKEADRANIRFLYAVADISERTAERWLDSLGFERDERASHLYRRRCGGA